MCGVIVRPQWSAWRGRSGGVNTSGGRWTYRRKERFPLAWRACDTSQPRTADDDCNRYDPRRAEIQPSGDLYNLLARPYMLLDVRTQAAADRILDVAQGNRFQCLIGRGNERPNRLDYMVMYWRK